MIAPFHRWFARCLPGESYIYHRGNLAIDRMQDRELDRLAREIITRGETSLNVMSGCRHKRGEIEGTGELRLVSRRVGEGEYEYAAVRR